MINKPGFTASVTWFSNNGGLILHVSICTLFTYQHYSNIGIPCCHVSSCFIGRGSNRSDSVTGFGVPNGRTMTRCLGHERGGLSPFNLSLRCVVHFNLFNILCVSFEFHLGEGKAGKSWKKLMGRGSRTATGLPGVWSCCLLWDEGRSLPPVHRSLGSGHLLPTALTCPWPC